MSNALYAPLSNTTRQDIAWVQFIVFGRVWTSYGLSDTYGPQSGGSW